MRSLRKITIIMIYEISFCILKYFKNQSFIGGYVSDLPWKRGDCNFFGSGFLNLGNFIFARS